jgi:twitching motility protein PilT
MEQRERAPGPVGLERGRSSAYRPPGIAAAEVTGQGPPSIDLLLDVLWTMGGSDLLLTAGTCPRIRVDGELRPAPDTAPLSPADTERLTASVLSPAQQAAFAAGTDIDFSFSWRDSARIRGSAFRQRGWVALALRLMPHRIPSFDELGLPASVRRFAALDQGLLLVTGPTGSGKSTTLASMIDWINARRAVHVLTIEDPIEYVHNHKRAAVNQREVGADTESFANALRSALREDPDVLLVGEMRDLTSIRFTLTLAETGHLVLATLHTNDTAQAVDRLVDVFPGDQQPQIRLQLAASLTGIVHQLLVPKVGGGRVAAFEVLVATSAVRNLIRESKTNQLRNAVVTGQRDGMQTIEASLNALLKQGAISAEDALSRSSHPADLAVRG